MTALQHYERLECTGLWRSDHASQRREVIVSFGEASLVLSDMQGRALAHWSLPAVAADDPNATPLVLRPGTDAEELLELDDPDMIAAIAQVQKAIAKSRPHPGRLRLILAGTTVLALVGFAIFWAPRAITSYTANVLPEVKRAQLGQVVLDHLNSEVGPFCDGPYGADAAQKLAERIEPNGMLKLHILPGTGKHPIVLPGSIVVLYENMVVGTDDPGVTAGHILAAQTRALVKDPLLQLLQSAGVRSALPLISSNTLTKTQVATLAQAALDAPNNPLNLGTLVTAFEISGVSASPYADHSRGTLGDQAAQDLIDADPYPTGAPQPLLPDGAWLGLQSICTDL